jgi:hypothetical protein
MYACRLFISGGNIRIFFWLGLNEAKAPAPWAKLAF